MEDLKKEEKKCMRIAMAMLLMTCISSVFCIQLISISISFAPELLPISLLLLFAFAFFVLALFFYMLATAHAHIAANIRYVLQKKIVGKWECITEELEAIRTESAKLEIEKADQLSGGSQLAFQDAKIRLERRKERYAERSALFLKQYPDMPEMMKKELLPF